MTERPARLDLADLWGPLERLEEQALLVQQDLEAPVVKLALLAGQALQVLLDPSVGPASQAVREQAAAPGLPAHEACPVMQATRVFLAVPVLQAQQAA